MWPNGRIVYERVYTPAPVSILVVLVPVLEVLEKHEIHVKFMGASQLNLSVSL
jgi:hypothetical protein